ncbi:MAG: hypothetical protein ACOZAK_04150 [Patescibacteria group bacterium]
MNWQGFLSSNWFSYLDAEHQALVRTAVRLAEDKELMSNLEDYSFIVFLMAKVYEAFIKKYLLDAGLIDDKLYHSKRFRIGRALNPDIRNNHRDEWWLYDDVVQHCGEAVGDALWQAWLEGRNRVVHSFPGEETLYSYEKMKKRISLIVAAMDLAQSCATNY